MSKNPYEVVKRRYVTEKATVLQNLHQATSNPSLRRCASPKYVFLVDRKANKIDIARAVEEIYQSENIRVVSVNTINMKPKARRVRGRAGFKNAYKKAVITLRPGDRLDQAE